MQCFYKDDTLKSVLIANAMNAEIDIQSLTDSLRGNVAQAPISEMMPLLERASKLHTEAKQTLLELICPLISHRNQNEKTAILGQVLGSMKHVSTESDQLSWFSLFCAPKFFDLFHVALEKGFQINQLDPLFVEAYLGEFFLLHDEISWDFWQHLGEDQKEELTPYLVDYLGRRAPYVIQSNFVEQWKEEIKVYARKERIKDCREMFLSFWSGVNLAKSYCDETMFAKINDFKEVFTWLFPNGISPEQRYAIENNYSNAGYRLEKDAFFFERGEALLDLAESRYAQKDLSSNTAIPLAVERKHRL